jgi:hypothetical protein
VAYRLVALLASTALAWATYVLVELPVRGLKSPVEMRRVTLRFAYSMVLVAIVGAMASRAIVQPVSARDAAIVGISDAVGDWRDIDATTTPGSVRDSVLFFGDSHMEQYWPRVRMLTRSNAARRTVLFHTLGGCLPIPGIERHGWQCSKFVADGFTRAAKPDVKVVVLAARWSGLTSYGFYRLNTDDSMTLDVLAPENAGIFDQFSDALARLHRLGKRVVVLLSSPQGTAFDPMAMVDRRWLIPRVKPVTAVARTEVASALEPVDRRIRAAAERAGAEIVEPVDWFCDATACPITNSVGRPMFLDGTHIGASTVLARASGLDRFVLINAP